MKNILLISILAVLTGCASAPTLTDSGSLSPREGGFLFSLNLEQRRPNGSLTEQPSYSIKMYRIDHDAHPDTTSTDVRWHEKGYILKKGLAMPHRFSSVRLGSSFATFGANQIDLTANDISYAGDITVQLLKVTKEDTASNSDLKAGTYLLGVKVKDNWESAKHFYATNYPKLASSYPLKKTLMKVGAEATAERERMDAALKKYYEENPDALR